MPTGLRVSNAKPDSQLVPGRWFSGYTPCCYTWRHGVELFFFIERALWIVSLLAEGLVIFRLIHDGLIRRYPFFTAFLTAEVICSLVAMHTGIRSRNYAEAFRICTLILSVFRLGVAAELYERICDHFPGIGGFRVGLAAVLVVLAALVTVFTVQPNLVDQWAFPQTVVLVAQRFQSEIFAGAFLLTWIFLRFVLSIRQPFRPNVLTHWTIATVYFGATGAAYLAILLSGGGTLVFPINCAMLAVNIGCFVAWFRFMRRSGEEFPAFQRLSSDQVRAVEQYNRALLETVTSLPSEISARQTENRDIPVHRARQH
jgi:hypothetical protein